jgi:hypothetical protein
MNSGPPGSEWVIFAIFAFYGLIILISLAGFVVWVVALADCVTREFPDPNQKLMWVLVIALTHAIGALIYLIVGKPRGRKPGFA